MLTAIRQWVIKTMMKGQTGVVQTMPKQQMIEMNVQITAQRFMQNGINPEDMKTVGQVENVINQLETPKVNVNPGITGVRKADVMDMKGNKIDTSKGIMGGEEIKPFDELKNYTKSKEDIVQDLVDQKFGKGYFDTVDESEAAIKARIEADNKKGIASMKKKLDDPEEKADGGRIGLLAGTVPKVLKLLKNKKKVQAAVDDIFPTGDYKYDAQMAADALVENNPKTFGNRLYDDLDQDTQMEIYSTVLEPITNKMATQMKLQRATRPEKTLASMNEGKGIDMSDPEIADEFGRFMKETDPKGYKELEQKVELSNFKTKDRKGNADGGRIGLKGGAGKAFIEFLKNAGKTMNDKSPVQAYKDYLKSVKDRAQKGDMKTLAPEMGIIAGGGILTNRFLKKKLEKMNEDAKAEVENKADGGRIGLKAGMTKRGFLKLMGSVGAGIGAAKSGIFSGFGKGAGKTVAKEVAQQTTSSMPPPYFFKLAEKIKNMGSDVTSTTERTISKSLKSKDGNAEYILEQDMVSGDTIIKKVNKEGDDMITDVQIMELRKGEDVITKDGKAMKTPDEYEEVTEVNKRIYKDDYNASDYTDGIEEIELKKIIDEVDDQAPSIKYASGGLAYMLGE